jgi:hypothetical protein
MASTHDYQGVSSIAAGRPCWASLALGPAANRQVTECVGCGGLCVRSLESDDRGKEVRGVSSISSEEPTNFERVPVACIKAAGCCRFSYALKTLGAKIRRGTRRAARS